MRSWDGSDCLADAGSTRVLSIAPEIVSYLTLEISAFWQAEDFDLTDRQTDGRTDRRTPFSSLVRAGIPCRAKKKLMQVGLQSCIMNANDRPDCEIFTSLHGMQTRYSDKKVVRLSIRLSNACIVTKRKKDLFTFLYHTKYHLA